MIFEIVDLIMPSLQDEQPYQTPSERVERLITAYDAGCTSARRYKHQGETHWRELAKAQGFHHPDELNCFIAALRNYS